MSKSNASEVIALLWLIAGYTVGGLVIWIGIVMFIGGIAASFYYAKKELEK